MSVTFEAKNLGNDLWCVLRTEDGLSTAVAVTSDVGLSNLAAIQSGTDDVPSWPYQQDHTKAQHWAEYIAGLLQAGQLLMDWRPNG